MATSEGTYRVIITGFGPFMNIKENPSADIQKLVVKHFEAHFPPSSNVKLLHNGVIVVERDHVDKEIDEIRTKIEANKAANPNDKYFLLHLGVAGSMPKDQLNLETRCFNAMNFKNQNTYAKDFRAEIENKQDLGAIYTCPIQLESIVNKSKRKSNHPNLTLSYSPGNYLCNYIL